MTVLTAKCSACYKIALRRLGLKTPLGSLLKELIIELRQGRLSLILVAVLTSMSDRMSMKLHLQIVH